jgi:hypothetical protein
MHYNVYNVFYSKFSQQHILATIGYVYIINCYTSELNPL